MSLCFFLKTLLLISMGMSFLLLGCGKKAETKKSLPVVERLPQTELDTYLGKQAVSCEGNQACPNYIAKVVAFHGSTPKFCTGFLTEEDVVATSASCLPRLLRHNGGECSRDVFFFFPKTWNRPAERVGCARVILASQLSEKDPVLWRDDVAFLQLDRSLSYRREARIIRDGIPNGRQFTTWMIDQQDEFFSIIKKGTCEAIHNNYVNPLVMNEFSPSMVFADCAVTSGGTGAPVIDNRGKIRGMISAEMDKDLRKYLESTGLLTDGLRNIFHGTNFACAPTSRDNDMADERECLKDLTYTQVDRRRSEMLSTNLLFGAMKKEFEESLNSVSHYVQFGVKLIPKGDIQETEVYPKCFKPLTQWLSSLNNNRNIYVHDVNLPKTSFRRVIDSSGRVRGITLNGDEKETYVQFSLKSLRNIQQSSILMWSKSEDASHFPNISEKCSESLF